MISSYTNGSENKTDFKYEFLINVFAMTVFYKDGIILFYV